MDNYPSSNMRRLKRVLTENGLSYTLETESDKNRAQQNRLCNFCAYQVPVAQDGPCVKYQRVAALAKENVISIVRYCADYQPILTFNEQAGMDSEFNTFRLGEAWFKRITLGTIVGLMSTKDNRLFGKARVLSVEHGVFDEMCAKHARKNHLLLNAAPEQAPELMRKIMQKAYGTNMPNMVNGCTVIYLRRHA